MERFSFGDDVAFVPRGDLLDRVTVAPLTSPFEEGALVQAAIFRFEPGGRLRGGRGMPQIFAVLEGSGEVSGANGVGEPIGAGEAIFLHEDEDHEMKSEAGLTVLILEGASLEPFRGRPAAPSAPE
jgi:quercetin dioxygenase-like cupin family protein